MNIRFGLLLAISLGLLSLTSCAVRQGDFTILSSKNCEISRVDLKRINFRRNISGSDTRVWFLFIPFGSAPTMEEAVDDCLENGNGDFMTSGVIYSYSYSFLLFSWGGWEVQGDVGNSLDANSADLKNRRIYDSNVMNMPPRQKRNSGQKSRNSNRRNKNLGQNNRKPKNSQSSSNKEENQRDKSNNSDPNKPSF